MSVRVYMSGGLVLVDGESAVGFHDLPGRKGTAIAAYLALRHLRPVSTSELADVLWDGSPPGSWKSSLKAHVSRTRKALRPIPQASISSGEGWYQMILPPGSMVDVLFAEDSVHQAEAAMARGDPQDAAGSAAVTAMIASRPVLPELEGEWLDLLRAEIQQVHLRALDVLLELWLADGQYEQAIADASRILEIDPLRESAYAALMSAHLETGHLSRGLAVYRDCRELLAAELGAGPGPRVEAVYEELLART